MIRILLGERKLPRGAPARSFLIFCTRSAPNSSMHRSSNSSRVRACASGGTLLCVASFSCYSSVKQFDQPAGQLINSACRSRFADPAG
jgi:hypothetical protein